MPRLKLGMVCLGCLLLCGCAGKRLSSAESAELILLPPADAPAEVLLRQKIRFVARDAEQQFLILARIERQSLRLALLLPSGQVLFELDYDGIELRQQNHAGVEIPGRDILASLQFASWPEAVLRRHYRSSEGWRIEISGHERNLLTSSGVLLRIARSSESLVVDNHLHDYRVIIQMLEKTEL